MPKIKLTAKYTQRNPIKYTFKNIAAISIISLLITGCNGGGSSSSTTQTITNLAPPSPMEIFQKVAVAGVTKNASFEKINESNDFTPITDLNQISNIMVSSVDNSDTIFTEYNEWGQFLASYTFGTFDGAYEINQEQIDQLTTQISPSDAYAKVLGSCAISDKFTPEELELYSYSYSVPTRREVEPMYFFNIHKKTAHQNVCFQSGYNILSSEITCVQYSPVKCNV